MSHGNLRRGGNPSQFSPDGWTVVGRVNWPLRLPPKASNELSNPGKINKGRSTITFGPSSVFAGRKDGEGRGIEYVF